MLDLVALIIAITAAARLTRLATTDAITAPIRDPITLRILRSGRERRELATLGPGDTFPPPRPWRAWLHTLATCRWCAGFWITAATITAAHATNGHPAYTIPATILGASYLVGWLADNEAGD